MQIKTKQRLSQYGISIAIALLIAGLVAYYELDTNGFSTANVMRYLCDGFFVSSTVMIGISVLMIISQADGFVAFSYLFYSVKYKFTPVKAHFEERKSYYDYRLEKASKHKDKLKAPYRILIVGIVFLVISLIFLYLFEMYYKAV